MSLRCVRVFLFFCQACGKQITETVAGDRKAGGRKKKKKDWRKSFCKLGKGHNQNALNLSRTIGCVALGERGGEETSLHFHVSSALYLIPPHVEPREKAFVLKSSSVYCTFCLPFLLLFPPPPTPPIVTTSAFTKSDSLASLC